MLLKHLSGLLLTAITGVNNNIRHLAIGRPLFGKCTNYSLTEDHRARGEHVTTFFPYFAFVFFPTMLLHVSMCVRLEAKRLSAGVICPRDRSLVDLMVSGHTNYPTQLILLHVLKKKTKSGRASLTQDLKG